MADVCTDVERPIPGPQKGIEERVFFLFMHEATATDLLVKIESAQLVLPVRGQQPSKPFEHRKAHNAARIMLDTVSLCIAVHEHSPVEGNLVLSRL
jgi:hypothetical protein